MILAAMFLMAGASALAQDSIRLRFEIAKNGSNVVNPDVTLKGGSAEMVSKNSERGETLLTSRQSMPCVFMRKILTQP